MTNSRDTEGASRSHDGQLAATKRADAGNWKARDERLKALAAGVAVQILQIPFPVITGNLEEDSERVHAWAQDRARNIIQGLEEHLR